uniref:Prolyl endopeptidase n=1 Tax=Aegilops tauschii subsp. strangulata TaxID=200361 RepID=A0A453L1U0_AEGTS
MHLIKEGFVHESRLCAMGSSAGSLLVGAVVNMLPNLFSAAVLKVPFLDICNTMLDPTLPLTILDYEEFGDPNIPVEFDAIRSYSPYDNLSPGKCYPSILVTASFNDTRGRSLGSCQVGFESERCHVPILFQVCCAQN